MNKKFLSVILFSALMVGTAGTFTSCKDYDDDIKDLQEQIDGQKSDLSSKVSAVESSISSLQAAQGSLENAIAAAKDDAEKAALEAQNKAIETAKAELETVKAELQAAIKASADDVDAVKAAVANAEEEMSKIVGRIQTLEAFKTTTETTLAKLAEADVALTDKITALNADLVALGNRLTAVEAQVIALENYKTSNDAAVSANKDAIDKLIEDLEALQEGELTEAMIQKIAEQVTAVVGAKLDVVSAALNKKVTHVSLYTTTMDVYGTRYVDLNLVSAEAVRTWTFGDKLAGEPISFKKGDKETFEESFIIRVSPTNATLDKSMIRLVNSQMNDLNGLLEVKTIEAYKELDVVSAALNKKVTHVSLYTTTMDVYGTRYVDLNLVSAEAVRTWTFGDKLAGEPISFKKGDKETFEESFIIRVSPTNATLDKSMIRLVNSQMNDLNGLLEVKTIEAYKELVTTRGISANGLWKVSVKLVDNYDADAYKAAAATYGKDGKKDKDILYAVMIGDSATDLRQVVSEYGLILAADNKEALRKLTFNVDKTSVAEIRNRWAGEDNSFSEDGTKVSYKELAWDTDEKYSPWAEPIIKNDDASKINVIADADDYRNIEGIPAYSVKAGQAFTVNFDEAVAENVRGFYITLDSDCAVESAPSEINAWKSYGVKGLNTVTSGSSLELTVPEGVNAEGDYIGFRVYAVNYDGSLVDPDGKAFYVYVGETAQNVANLTLTMDAKIITPLATTVSSKTDAFSTANWGRAQGGTYSMVIKDAEGTDVTTDFSYTNFIFKNNKKVVVNLLADDTKLIDAATITSVATVEMSDVVASKMKDNMTYTATITAKNGTSGIVAVSTIKFTKTLPAFPATVYPYTNILVQNNLKIYPVYNNAQAEYDMKNVWHGIAKDATGTTGYANLIFSEINSDPSKVVVDYVPASNIISAPAALVNPKDEAFGTKFPMAIHYNYGKISNKYNAKTKAWEVVDHNPAWGTDFTVEFGNYIYDCTFAWSKAAPKVTYPGAVGKSTYIAFSDLKITDWYKEALDLTKMTTSGTKENTYMKSVTLHFLTGDKYDRVDEYYECVAGATYAKYDSSKKTYTTVSDIKEATHIQLTSKSNASQGSDVPTKIQLVFTDNFNYEVDVTMNTPFTMTFQQQ